MRFVKRPNPTRREFLRDRARELRNASTPAEVALWIALRGRKLGVQFRRQHRIGEYIVDFYCPEREVVVELDGPTHREDEQADRDEERDAYLSNRGLKVLRIGNHQVHENLQGVIEYIAKSCGIDLSTLPALPPTPSRSTRRGNTAASSVERDA